MPFLNDKDNITYCVELTPGNGVTKVNNFGAHAPSVLIHKSPLPNKIRIRKETVIGSCSRWLDGWLYLSTGVTKFDDDMSVSDLVEGTNISAVECASLSKDGNTDVVSDWKHPTAVTLQPDTPLPSSLPVIRFDDVYSPPSKTGVLDLNTGVITYTDKPVKTHFKPSFTRRFIPYLLAPFKFVINVAKRLTRLK